jgi:hypothetical protein
MRKPLHTTATLVLLAGLAAGGTALAQSAPQPGPGPGMMGTRSATMCADQQAHMAGMLAYAETKLGITEAQRPAWRNLADTLKAAHEPMNKLCTDTAAQPQATLPERLATMQKMQEAHLDAMRKAVPAITQFYQTTLTTEQRKIADQMGPGMGMGGHGHGMRHGR